METNRNPIETAAVFFRLTVILLVFPIIVVYVIPNLETVRQFYNGDRAHWFDYWIIAVALEWFTLFIVIASVRHRRQSLETIGFPLNLARREKFIALSILFAFVAFAFVGAGGPQSFLERLPTGLRLFIPPSALGARLFWIVVALTAAICEETLWRGFAITELRAKTGSTLLAVLISSLSFVFFHGGFQQGAVVFAYRFVISLVLSAVYIRAGNLQGVIVIHFLMDASSLLAIQID